MTKPTSKRYSPEVRERAIRMVREDQGDYASQWEAMASIAAKIGCSGETLRKWVRQANEILRKASAYFAAAELDHRFKP